MLFLRYLPRNLTVLFDMVLGGLAHADWDGAWARGGVGGMLREFLAALTGFSAWPFFVNARGAWSSEQVAALLRAHGIAAWGWGYANGEFFFRVKHAQAHWAQYLLLRNGVPLGGRLLTGARFGAHSADPHSDEQPARGPAAAQSAESGRATPLQQFDRLLDRIADL
jgi:hypothetical protein